MVKRKVDDSIINIFYIIQLVKRGRYNLRLGFCLFCGKCLINFQNVIHKSKINLDKFLKCSEEPTNF